MRVLILLLLVSCASGPREVSDRKRPRIVDCDLRQGKTNIAACQQWVRYRDYMDRVNRRRGDK